MTIARLTIVVLAAATMFTSPASARKLPKLLTPTFVDRVQPVGAAVAPPTCTMRFEIIDKRSSSELAGVVADRAVRAPTDFNAWMHAVLGGLYVRGIRPIFEEGDNNLPAGRITLQTAWIAETVGIYNANVVLRVEANDGALDQLIRGRSSRAAFLQADVGAMQNAMNGAFANALDNLIPALMPICVVVTNPVGAPK